MKRLTVGVLAHVDAGKTSCIESLLYLSGAITKLGRVDHQDSFLDYEVIERNRGITVTSKEAHFTWNDTEINLIDTPGHLDFSGTMERTLQVLDVALLIINAQEGVQSHTKAIWKYLEQYQIPTILFINKMDIAHYTTKELLDNIRQHLSERCIDWNSDEATESVAMLDDDSLEEFLQKATLSQEKQNALFMKRSYYPCLFGSALKQEGFTQVLDLLGQLGLEADEESPLLARVYKVSYDNEKRRYAHLRIYQGQMHVKDKLNESDKIDQIRLYNGPFFQTLNAAFAGMVVAIKGADSYEVGDTIGEGLSIYESCIEPCLRYAMVPKNASQFGNLLIACKRLKEEDPLLHVSIDNELKRITIQVVGDLQLDALQENLKEHEGIEVVFEEMGIVYKETIRDSAVGVGHFEPLRHYAEVQLLLEPTKRNQGIVIENICARDTLAPNFQKTILSTLNDTIFRGVLLGSPITDIKITLVTGKGHLKHTEGGDFREATIRAVRQGLMKANAILLEPYGDYVIEVKPSDVSRVLYDLEQLHCTSSVRDANLASYIEGNGPLQALWKYQKGFQSYTKGEGTFAVQYAGYNICHNSQEIIKQSTYNPEADLEQPTGSIFCAHGAGYYVPWQEVDTCVDLYGKETSEQSYVHETYHVGEEEVSKLVEKSGGNNRNEKKQMVKHKQNEDTPRHVTIDHRTRMYVVDGYNVLFAMEDLSVIAQEDLANARDKLIDKIYNYIGYTNTEVMLVFDGYKVKNSFGSVSKEKRLTLVYTKTDETADAYIAKVVTDLCKDYQIVVVSSDGLIQNAIFAQGAMRMSSREFIHMIDMRLSEL